MKYEAYMQRCIELAQNGAGNASPNPMVGAVVVYADKVIGEGYHQLYGEAHAEVNAIKAVKDKSLLAEGYNLRFIRTVCRILVKLLLVAI